jgi:hypothetical protein
MVLVKVLGLIDTIASVIFLCIIFSLGVNSQLILGISGLLFMKSLFILKGDLLSVIDLIASITLALNLFFHPFVFLLWFLSLLLMSKGFASFL